MSGKDHRLGSTMVNGELKTYKRGYTAAEYTPWIKHILKDDDLHPVLGAYVTDYLNREDVRAALNIPTTAIGWEECSNDIEYTS